MAASALIPARSNSLFFTECASWLARCFSESMTAYSAFGIVKLSRTSLVFGGLAAAGGAAGAGAGAFFGAARRTGARLAAALRATGERLAGARLAATVFFVGMSGTESGTV